MKNISKDDVVKISKLARLSLNEEELERIAGQMESILEYVKQLGEVDTSKVPPTAQSVDMKNVFRDDRSSDFSGVDKILKIAPEIEDDYFKVKKVIE